MIVLEGINLGPALFIFLWRGPLHHSTWSALKEWQGNVVVCAETPAVVAGGQRLEFNFSPNVRRFPKGHCAHKPTMQWGLVEIVTKPKLLSNTMIYCRLKQGMSIRGKQIHLLLKETKHCVWRNSSLLSEWIFSNLNWCSKYSVSLCSQCFS